MIRRMIHQAGINPMGVRWPSFVIDEEDGAIVGVGQVKQHGSGTRELASIAVVPERQGTGIGSRIIRMLLAREQGVLYLTCRSELEGYYRRFGFSRVEPREYPAYFRRSIPMFNAVGRRFGFQILVMKRDSDRVEDR